MLHYVTTIRTLRLGSSVFPYECLRVTFFLAFSPFAKAMVKAKVGGALLGPLISEDERRSREWLPYRIAF